MPPCTWIDVSHARTAASAACDFAAAAAKMSAGVVILRDAPCCPIGEVPRELDRDIRVDDWMRDGLIGADLLAELLAVGDVRDGELDCARADTDRLERASREQCRFRSSTDLISR